MNIARPIFAALLFVGMAHAADVIDELTRRAEAGEPMAQNDLGSRYQGGDGVPKDFAKAFDLFTKASTSGAAIPQNNLGFMYDMGLGVEQDRKVANEWYRKAADQGYAPAMLNLGLNIAGGKGVPADYVEGMKWIDLARFYTQSEKDMIVKYRVRGAYDALKKEMTKAQFQEAEKKSKAWSDAFRATPKKD